MCVFCNQHSISGVEEFDVNSVISDIDSVLSTIDRTNTELELAFFGGSFTGIDRKLMISLLEIGKSYLDRGIIDSMRCSTRPDYINSDILSILKRYGMRTIELGIQSMDDAVLLTSKRGHDSSITIRACEMIIEAGFELVGQMMIGLPSATRESEIMCAEFISRCGARSSRVYPTVVFRDTELCNMSLSGAYAPLNAQEAVIRTRDVLDVFDKHDIRVIRVGLCSSENLVDDSQVYAGANDVAIGEMAMSALFLKRICSDLDKLQGIESKKIVITGPVGSVSKIAGHKKINKQIICEKYKIKSIRILENEELIGYNIRISIDN